MKAWQVSHCRGRSRISHHPNTIAYHDQVLLMDGWDVAEFDTVLDFYDQESSIFCSPCNEASLEQIQIPLLEITVSEYPFDPLRAIPYTIQYTTRSFAPFPPPVLT
ncbi:hypothetical protein Hypma_006108 [Hypsizygus marmoreus]|uniref:Uncharacterized protein n=1 Tax=Hypsizygus marmoreus TaxID=39966 RepID=A0A369JTC8_HYPMA|nr:hypothetical protein Hypma_006108 [Hypsizygus marmoreus]